MEDVFGLLKAVCLNNTEDLVIVAVQSLVSLRDTHRLDFVQIDPEDAQILSVVRCLAIIKSLLMQMEPKVHAFVTRLETASVYGHQCHFERNHRTICQ